MTTQNASSAYPAHQLKMEQEVLDRVQTGQAFFDPYADAPHWLACHRLVNKGVLKENFHVSNCFYLATNNTTKI